MTETLRADVAIVGGGIVGASAALFLRRFGLSVVLLERGQCGAAASGVNYGGVRTQGRAMAQLPLSLRARKIWARLPELIGIDGEYVQSGHLKLARSLKWILIGATLWSVALFFVARTTHHFRQYQRQAFASQRW